jgi:hypothetical protein
MMVLDNILAVIVAAVAVGVCLGVAELLVRLAKRWMR